MAQEIHLGNGEGALLEVDDQAGRLQPPKHLFFTMWRGEAQGLLDRRMIPSRSRAANSAFAAASFSVSSRRKGEAMGGPLVSKWCSTP